MMDKHTEFIGIVYDKFLEGRTYIEWLPIYEQKLEQGTYDLEHAARYLDDICILGTIYSRLNRWNNVEALANKVDDLCQAVPEFEDDAQYVCTLLKSRLYRERRQFVPFRDTLIRITDYAIRKDNRHVLCYVLNMWGNYFRNFEHYDLALLFYGYCLDYTHQNYLFLKNLYPEIASYPISNILNRQPDEDKRYELMKKIFNDLSFDRLTRLYFGEQLIAYADSQKREFDKSKLRSLQREVFGDVERMTVEDHLFEYYFNNDIVGMTAYYEAHHQEFDSDSHFLYYALSDREDKAEQIKPWLNTDLFITWANVLSSYMEDLSVEDQEVYFLQFLNYVRSSFFVIDYKSCSGFTDYLLDFGNTMFSFWTVGNLMLQHAGDNGIYTFAEELVQKIMPHCRFRAGTGWMEDAVTKTRMGDALLQREIIESCHEVLNVHCCFENKFATVTSNFEVCRNILAEDNDSEVNAQIIQFENEFKQSPSWRLFARASYSEKNAIPKLGRVEDPEMTTTDNSKFVEESQEGETHYVEIPYMRDNPDYQELKDLLGKYGWEFDEKDLNINILHAYLEDDHYLLYLFYSPTPDWLGDEESFNGENPLWYSEKSHQVSPVWRLRNYVEERQIHDLTGYPIVVMLPPTYVINGDDMQDSWEGNSETLKVVVVKFRWLIRFLGAHDKLPTETDFVEVSRWQHTPYEEGKAESESQSRNAMVQRQAEDEKSQKMDQKKKESIRESIEERRYEAQNAPWNLLRVYQVWKSTPYHRDTMGSNTYKTSDGTYDLTKLGLLQVVNDFFFALYPSGNSPASRDTMLLADHLNEITLDLYFKSTSVKMQLTADRNATKGNNSEDKPFELKDFVIESFSSDSLDFIKKIDQVGLVKQDLYLRGNIGSKLFEAVVQIKNAFDDGFIYVDDIEKGIEKLKKIGELFNSVLVPEVWEQGVSGVSAPILIDVVKREAEKTAKTAIMSRNMSHNLGSHVMAYLKRDLATVGDIIRKGVLHDFYPLPDFFASCESGDEKCDVKELMNRIETYTKEVEMPFLVGLGKFISYLQERQDYIATVATFYIPYFSAVNFKDDIYDTINPDYRYLRHSDRRGNRPENILMKYIALSEGLSRDITQQGPRRNDIVIRFRTFDGINDYLFQKQRNKTVPNGPGRDDLNDMRQYSFYLPGGIVGRQALFTILENLIRNSAKHGLWRKKHNLEFTFDLYRGRDFTTNPHGRELYNFLKEEPEWSDILNSEDNILNKFYILTLTDNLDISDSSFNSLKNAIKEEYVSAETGKMINKHKGIKEIRISAAWMRGIADDLNIPSDEPPVVTVRKVNNSLQYVFCVLAPKKVLLLLDDKEDLRQMQSVIRTLEGWYADSIDHYKKTSDKSYDIIVLRNGSDLESLRPISADRLVVAEELFDNILNNKFDQAYSEVELYKKLYHIHDHDEPLLISDGKTGSPISTHIHLVSADAEALTKNVTYRYCYRTHHQDPQEFSDYMNSTLREHMNAVEGITGNNSTDRLIRNEKLDDVWYFKHLHALRTKVAIFDERMFSKVTGLEDKELTANPSPFVNGSCESVIYAQKRVWFFNVIYDEEQNLFNVYGLQGEHKDSNDIYFGKITKVAEIAPQKLDMGELGILPSISVKIFDDNYKKFADYISIHQGLMDKIYDAFKIKETESYSEEVQKDFTKVSLAMKTAMCSASVRIYEAFYGGEEIDDGPKDEFEQLLDQFLNGPGYRERRFCPGFFVHSGRSKPSEFDMPQKQPFIQYAAIENAAYDCKYSLVELLKSARYEPSE